jgi:WD40 repeat protein
MVILESDLITPTGLMFSPDGLSLLAVDHNRVQLWPRWLGRRPRRAWEVQPYLERYAFSSGGDRVYLYASASSITRVLGVRGAERGTVIPSGGPSWFHFDTAGGFVLVSHNTGRLTRFDYVPTTRARFRQARSIERTRETRSGGSVALGSHYDFGAICGPAGIFLALEYRYHRSEPYDGLVVRSVADGTILWRAPLTDKTGPTWLAGRTPAIHPSGRYCAALRDHRIRLFPLCEQPLRPRNPAPSAPYRAVAFHPSGQWLTALGADEVAVYDTTTWNLVRTLAWGIGALCAVCFSPDGTHAAVIGQGAAAKGRRKRQGGTIVVWDWE